MVARLRRSASSSVEVSVLWSGPQTRRPEEHKIERGQLVTERRANTTNKCGLHVRPKILEKILTQPKTARQPRKTILLNKDVLLSDLYLHYSHRLCSLLWSSTAGH